MTDTPSREFVVVVWGDSIAAGTPDLQWPALAERTCLLVTNTGKRVRVVNQGAGGMAAAQARREFDRRIMQNHPDLVLIQFGFNDIRYDGSRVDKPISTVQEFESHISEMIALCRNEAKASVVVLGNHRARLSLVLPSGLQYDKARVEYNRASRRAARKAGVPFHDMSEELMLPEARWSDYVCEDGVHLSPLGYHAYGRRVANIIMDHIAPRRPAPDGRRSS